MASQKQEVVEDVEMKEEENVDVEIEENVDVENEVKNDVGVDDVEDDDDDKEREYLPVRIIDRRYGRDIATDREEYQWRVRWSACTADEVLSDDPLLYIHCSVLENCEKHKGCVSDVYPQDTWEPLENVQHLDIWREFEMNRHRSRAPELQLDPDPNESFDETIPATSYSENMEVYSVVCL